MSYLRKRIESLREYVPGFQPGDDSFIKLNTNENPYPPSPGVLKVAGMVGEDMIRLYSDPKSERLRRQIAVYHGIDTEQVIAGNGSDEILGMIFRACADSGDRVLLTYPSYSLYEVMGELYGAHIVRVELQPDFSLPEEFYETKVKLTFLANPNSPSGVLLPRETIERVCTECTGILVVDEAYVDFADRHESLVGLLGKFRNLVLTRSFSKAFALAGMRIGYAMAKPSLIQGMMKIKDSYNLNSVSERMAETALIDREYYRKNIERIIEDRQYFSEQLAELGFYVYPSSANFVLARTDGADARKLYQWLFERKILVRYFDAPRLKECLRISIGTRAQMECVINEIRRFLDT